jgi:hypothetical protein
VGELLPIGTKVRYTVDPAASPTWKLNATVTDHVEGWLELEFDDESRAVVRPSRVHPRSPGDERRDPEEYDAAVSVGTRWYNSH